MMSQLITLDHIFAFAARILPPFENDDDDDDSEFAAKILDRLTCEKENNSVNFANILYRVFPSLANYCRPPSDVSIIISWATIRILVHSILGIPPTVIDLQLSSEISRENMIRNLAVLFFFDQVARDNTFQGEFTLSSSASSSSIQLSKILRRRMTNHGEEIELPNEIVEFVQSKESVNVLYRGGCIPIADVASSSPRQQPQNSRNPNRQLEFSRVEEISDEEENDHQNQHQHHHQQFLTSVASSCDSLRHILASYADMVDAALGNSRELSESSQHRTALQAGLRSIDRIMAECQQQSGRKDESSQQSKSRKRKSKTQDEGNISPGTYIQQNLRHHNNSDGEGPSPSRMSEEMQSMIIRVIRERDQAREEVAKLREQKSL